MATRLCLHYPRGYLQRLVAWQNWQGLFSEMLTTPTDNVMATRQIPVSAGGASPTTPTQDAPDSAPARTGPTNNPLFDRWERQHQDGQLRRERQATGQGRTSWRPSSATSRAACPQSARSHRSETARMFEEQAMMGPSNYVARGRRRHYLPRCARCLPTIQSPSAKCSNCGPIGIQLLRT